MKNQLAFLLIAIAQMFCVSNSFAHFLWLVPTDESGEKVSLYFSEGPEPDSPDLLKRVSTVQAVPYRSEKSENAVPFQFEDNGTRLIAKHQGATAWTLHHLFGTHGRDEKNLIIYSAASVACIRPGMDDNDAISLPKKGYTAEPSFDGEKLTIQIWKEEKPAIDVAVELHSANNHHSLRTDKKGKVEVQGIQPGVCAVRCLETDATTGEHEGVAYQAIKKYYTISFIVPSLNRVTWEERGDIGVLPEPITSFGATVVDDVIYAYGGHTGGAHSYSQEEQFNKLVRLDLASNENWEVIAEGPRVQGNALVGFQSSVILVGGFTAENKKGEKSRLVSQSLVQQYDLQRRQWTDLPNLPEPRSSMDATVLDDYLYAVGGWAMNGESEEAKWHKTAWRLSLREPNSSWQAIAAPPFERRALAVVAHAGRVIVIGGMNKDGGTTTETSAYDPNDDKWVSLGAIAGVPMNGFGAAAADVNGKLIVSTADGSIQQLNDADGTWHMIGQMPTGRFFHRMLPVSKEHVGIFGGANMNVGKFRESIFFSVKPD